MARRKSVAGRTEPLWSVPIPIADVPETGRAITLAADETTRAAIAKAAGLAALPRLDVSAELFRHGRDGVRIVGQVAATVGQTCVVSLEPLQSEIAEPFDLVFVPPTAHENAPEVTVDDGAEPPETLHDGAVNIGAVAMEFLLLGIDPYPRKAGAAFAAAPTGDPVAHPFAALAALKK